MSYYEKKRNGEDNRGNKTIVVRWNDNTRVIEASDVHGDNPVLKSTRYFRGEHRQKKLTHQVGLKIATHILVVWIVLIGMFHTAESAFSLRSGECRFSCFFLMLQSRMDICFIKP